MAFWEFRDCFRSATKNEVRLACAVKERKRVRLAHQERMPPIHVLLAEDGPLRGKDLFEAGFSQIDEAV